MGKTHNPENQSNLLVKNIMLSIITVCKDAIRQLQKTILSVENVENVKNDYNFEYIIIDGMSTDSTQITIKESYKKGIVDNFLIEEDSGIYEAMNKGIHLCSGNYIYFLNAGDEIFSQDVISHVYNAFKNNPEIDLLYFDHIGINQDKTTGYSTKPTKLDLKYFQKSNICHQAIFYRKTSFEKIGLFDASYKFLADYEWNLRAFYLYNLKAGYIPYPACYFDNCGIHTQESVKHIVDQERRRAIESHTKGKESFCFEAKNLSLNKKQNDVEENKIRIIFVAYGPNHINGPNVWLQRFLSSLKKRGFIPEVMFMMSSSSKCIIVESLLQSGITCHILQRKKYTEENIIQLLSKLKTLDPDIFTPNLSIPAYFAAKWVKNAGVPTVGILHSDDNFHKELAENFVSAHSAFPLSGIVCVSNHIEAIIRKTQKNDIQTLKCPCGVDLPAQIAKKPNEELRLIYTGRLIQRQKRIFDVINSCKKIVSAFQGVSVSFYGEDRENGQIIEKIQNFDQKNCLRYGGILRNEEIYPTLIKHHVFILLSDYEGMSVSLMEAMACGLVPICTRTKSGATEIIKHNENGLLVDNREEDFLHAVERLKYEPGLWERLSQGARKTIQNGYTTTICADRWAEFLKGLIHETGQKKEIPVPDLHELNLPPVKQTDNGMCREDKRMPENLKNPSITPNLKPISPDANFINPSLSPDSFPLERQDCKMDSQNSKSFCTISTADYLPYVLALNESILQFDPLIQLNVLISDNNEDFSDIKKRFPNIDFYWVGDLCQVGVAKQIYDKYRNTDMDSFRWSMKPVFMKYLIETEGYKKVLYVDNDIHFFNDYHFLFEALDQSNVLLTPHWRASNPNIDSSNFLILYTEGLYNGGFIGANRNAIDALDWWATVCDFICVKDSAKGQFDDQTHLNLLPVYFDGVKILKNRGCNVANWNMVECRRIKGADHNVLINGNTPIIFIHFTKSTIRGIATGKDSELVDYFQKYSDTLSKYGIEICKPEDFPVEGRKIP